MEQLLAIVQGGYFAITGLWPLLSIRTFLLVTGPKTDIWLVRMVGLLAAAIGIPLLAAGLRGNIPNELSWVALLSAAAFLAIDVYYSLRGVIGKVYLLDAAVEVVFIAFWGVVLLR